MQKENVALEDDGSGASKAICMAMDAKKFKEYFNVDVADIAGQLRLTEPVYARILKIAVTTTEASLPLLEDAIRNNDREGVARIVHEIKGVYANLRLAFLAELMAEAGACSCQGDEAGLIGPALAEFKVKFDQLKSVLSS